MNIRPISIDHSLMESYGLDISHIYNLLTLAKYLINLPENYNHFDMKDYAREYTGSIPDAEDVPKMIHACGSVACAVGHGPVAGIAPRRGEWWGSYVSSNFTGDDSDYNGRIFEQLFESYWSSVDNTPHGAGLRIYYFLENGLDSICGDTDRRKHMRKVNEMLVR